MPFKLLITSYADIELLKGNPLYQITKLWARLHETVAFPIVTHHMKRDLMGIA